MEKDRRIMALTPKQQAFVREYLIDLNATQAYLRAGFKVKPTSARVQSCRLLADPNIASAIEAAMGERAKRTEITQDRVLQELARIAFFDLRTLYREDGSLKAMHELDDEAAAVLAGVDVVETKGNAAIGGEDGIRHVAEYVKKVKIPDKVAALGLAMRHLGMLKDKTELTGPNGGPVVVEKIERIVVDPAHPHA
jgi:phage terminase small subunit